MKENQDVRLLTPLEHLSTLRSTWSDEIPHEVIHSDSGIKSKARKNWFIGVVADVANALGEGEIKTHDGKKAAKKLISRFTSRKFVRQPLTKRQDIELANKLIDIILSDRS